MARWVMIYRWKPEKTKEVLQRFDDFVSGRAPEVMDATKKCKWIAWDFPSAYGQTSSVLIVEGSEADLSKITRYWWDLGTYEILPCVSFDTIVKFYPNRIIDTL